MSCLRETRAPLRACRIAEKYGWSAPRNRDHRVTFDGPAPTLAPVPGVEVASSNGSSLRLEVSPGSVRALIAELARQPVVTLVSREPSLEEIFLRHYDSSDGQLAG